MDRERPLLVPFFAFVSGLVIADISGVLLPLYVAVAALCCLLLCCAFRSTRFLTFGSCVFFLVWGLYALTPWKSPLPLPNPIQKYAAHSPVTIEGVIRTRPVSTTNGSSFVLQAAGVITGDSAAAACGSLMVYVSDGEVTLARGDRIRFVTRIARPHRLGLPGEFDYARYLSFQGIYATARVARADEIVLMRGAAEDSLLRRLDLAARQMGDFIRSSLPDNDVSSVLVALLLGDQKRIPDQLAGAYTRAGVNHILSISGFHVGIIAYFIVQLGVLIATRSEWLALRCNLRRLVMLLALPAMVMYLLLTGAAPATTRSVIMLATFVLALYVERETDPVNALLISALVLLALNPPTLFDVSFQLSFLALWGIVVIVPPVMGCFRSLQWGWQRTLLQFVVASCAASFVTAVPVLFAFNQASFTGIISNFLIVPLLGYGAVLTGFCALPFVYCCAPLANLFLWLAGKLVLLSNWLVTLFAEFPLLSFHGITKLDMLVFMAFMCAITFIRGRRMKFVLCMVLPSLAILAHAAAPSKADGRLHITMLSVGQAEALLVRTPDGSTMLVDGGGYLHENPRDFGERVLAPALFKLGVQRIDRMVLTHSHPDHIGGLLFVARAFPVGEFWEAYPGGSGEQYDQLRSILSGKRVQMRSLSAGDSLSLEGVTLAILSPLQSPADMTKSIDDPGTNDESLVFRLTYGKFSMLFSADSGYTSEARMLANGWELASTVLKVGHHGSRFSTSDAFLTRVAPQVALISAGHGNIFGLPSRITTDKLQHKGIQTYRTDLDGTIEMVSDGISWQVSTPFRP